MTSNDDGQDASAHLSKLSELAHGGADIIIACNPSARLAKLDKPPARFRRKPSGWPRFWATGYAATVRAATLVCRRRILAPIRPKPMISISQVAASGTCEMVSVVLPSREV
jgi:hypothetical protein